MHYIMHILYIIKYIICITVFCNTYILCISYFVIFMYYALLNVVVLYEEINWSCSHLEKNYLFVNQKIYTIIWCSISNSNIKYTITAFSFQICLVTMRRKVEEFYLNDWSLKMSCFWDYSVKNGILLYLSNV